MSLTVTDWCVCVCACVCVCVCARARARCRMMMINIDYMMMLLLFMMMMMMIMMIVNRNKFQHSLTVCSTRSSCQQKHTRVMNNTTVEQLKCRGRPKAAGIQKRLSALVRHRCRTFQSCSDPRRLQPRAAAERTRGLHTGLRETWVVVKMQYAVRKPTEIFANNHSQPHKEQHLASLAITCTTAFATCNRQSVKSCNSAASYSQTSAKSCLPGRCVCDS